MTKKLLWVAFIKQEKGVCHKATYRHRFQPPIQVSTPQSHLMNTIKKTMNPGVFSAPIARPLLALALVSLGLGASAHAACMPLALSMPSFLAASWVVSSGQSLQSQINSAAAGDNITVMSGTYNENITITNGLTIQGSGGIVAVTGSVTASNAALPIYLSDIAFGKSGASGITVIKCQNFRADRCNFVGGGDFNFSGSSVYCYKDSFSASANSVNSNNWTFQRCSVAGNISSATSTAKLIGSSVAGTFNHNQGEITIFQSTLNGGAGNNITLASTNNGWLCYSTIQGMNFAGGNVQVVGNFIGNATINNNFTYFAAGVNATIRNNVYANDGRYQGGGGWPHYGAWQHASTAIMVNSDAGIVNIFNNTIWNVYQGIGITGAPAGVVIRGNIFYNPSNNPNWSVNTSASGVIIDCNDFTTAVNGGTQTGNINQNPNFANTSFSNGSFTLNAGSPCINAGPTNDATFLNFDGTRNTMGAYGGHSYDPTGRTTTNPVVLSGTVSPTYVKQGQAVTISARAAVIAAP
jgi:hypothetical protein